MCKTLRIQFFGCENSYVTKISQIKMLALTIKETIMNEFTRIGRQAAFKVALHTEQRDSRKISNKNDRS